MELPMNLPSEQALELNPSPMVTRAQYIDWLGKHSGWTREQAAHSERADGNYLRNNLKRRDAKTDEGRRHRGDLPITEVSWCAGQAYCAELGGLAPAGPVDAPGPADTPQEWRIGVDGGYMAQQGQVVYTLSPTVTRSQIGFRCRDPPAG
jgi:hypothetical protein